MAYSHATICIKSGASASDAVNLDAPSRVVVIETPSALTNAVEVQVNASGNGFRPLYSGGSKVTVDANGVHVFSPLRGQKFRVVSGGNEGADRDFHITLY